MTTNRATLLLRLGSGITVLVNDLADANYIGLSVPGATIALSADEADHLAVLSDDNGHQRLTINTTTFNSHTGRWDDGITWDELQRIKNQCGLGDRWAVEIYPPETEVVEAANMRHLWLIDTPTYGWRHEKEQP